MGDWSFDKELKVGDKIVFEDMIHYTIVKTNMFNGIPHPALAWGNYPDEKYRCLIFWYKNRINMTVNEFYNSNGETYSCCRFYTTELCLTIDEYNKISDEQLASKAYNAWCTGAR